ncbi:MAG: tetratricopeptide repeat protein [Deltaproteobacteria bacterium]|nr:tetratricopeptide repeat protein [Deltaproteobacteria bacterium]
MDHPTRPVLAVLLLAATGCATSVRLAYTPAELRDEVARRGVPRAAAVIPHELDESHLAWARALPDSTPGEADRVQAITEALFSPDGLGLRYQDGVSTTARETIEGHAGNCLGLASVFIGLARAAGLRAYYMDASVRASETRQGADDVAVNSGHVTAVVQLNDKTVGLDFGRLGPVRWYRVLDDVEALAHFYNNRGFERIQRAGADSAEAWRAAEPDFRLAVQVMPELGRAWNNLGLAAVRQGRQEEAIRAYRAAILRDPTLAAPWNNLGSLHLHLGKLAEAEEDLMAAARLDPTASHIQYNLAVVRMERGDREGAARALRRALVLRADYPAARALLARLDPAPRR